MPQAARRWDRSLPLSGGDAPAPRQSGARSAPRRRTARPSRSTRRPILRMFRGIRTGIPAFPRMPENPFSFPTPPLMPSMTGFERINMPKPLNQRVFISISFMVLRPRRSQNTRPARCYQHAPRAFPRNIRKTAAQHSPRGAAMRTSGIRRQGGPPYTARARKQPCRIP